MKRSSREQEDDVIEEQLTSLRKSMAELPEDVRHALCSLIRQESDAAEPDSSAERPAVMQRLTLTRWGQEDDVRKERLAKLRKSIAELPQDVRHVLFLSMRQGSDVA